MKLRTHLHPLKSITLIYTLSCTDNNLTTGLDSIHLLTETNAVAQKADVKTPQSLKKSEGFSSKLLN